MPIDLAVMDFNFMGGSMGSVVGEKIARLTRRSVERHVPLVIVSASGGARMQEGVLSLMQMAKSSVEIARLRAVRVPFISILTNPTTGGVSASYAMQGDVILAEPGAVVGFAGPRVIKQTIGQDLPPGFQRRLPTDPVVLPGRLPLSLRATREPHKVEPRADRGAPGRAGPSGAALSRCSRRGHERQGLDLRVHGDGAARPGPQGRVVHIAASRLGAGACGGGR